MASFPEDYEIRVSEVTMLWAADGLLKPNADDTLEEVALQNLKELVNRNLIMVKKLDSRGHMKCLIVHDLVRDLCLREAQAEKFFYADNGVGAIESPRRLVFHHSSSRLLFHTVQQKRHARSFILLGKRTDLTDMPLMSLLRVFFLTHYVPRLMDITQFANLRFIKYSGDELFADSGIFDNAASLTSSVSFLWNLETLIVQVPYSHEPYSLPCGIWELQHIRHLIFSRKVIFPDPPTAHNYSALSHLQTLKKVIISSNKVLCRIPNIKDMEIECSDEELQPPGFWNLVHCHKLETLSLHGTIRFTWNELNTIKLFPDYLKKLTLSHCNIPWERMTIVGSLPNLEVVKIKQKAFVGEEWNTTEGEFLSLKFLSIDCSPLEAWRVENYSHFPCLEYLRLRDIPNLEEIPDVFGESMTLKSIQLDICQASVVISAKQILDEQENMGCYDLTVEAHNPCVTNMEQQMELENLPPSDRFHIQMNRRFYENYEDDNRDEDEGDVNGRE